MEKSNRNLIPPADGKHYFKLFLPLLAYADMDNPLIIGSLEDMKKRADIFWDDPSKIDAFIDDMDHNRTTMRVSLTQEDREILRSWKRCKREMFYVAAHRANGSLLVDSNDQVYRVLGIQSTLEELLPELPIMAMTTILPWKDVLITEGILVPIYINNPGNIKRHLQAVCQQALDQGTVITTF